MTWRNWISGLVIAASCGLVSPARAADSAVVLMYHRVGTPSASTNTPVEMFKDHLRLLRSEKYAVLPLTTVLASLRGGDPLPDRTIVITFDNAYRRLTETAIPLLQEAGLPFTVFVSTDGVDQGTKDLMTWEQLRKLAEEGVEIASNGAG
ncbi:MAG: polysaccharide deacetylase family protein, partial [Magnetospiraceae bacterium]